jgi:hypothetical protein
MNLKPVKYCTNKDCRVELIAGKNATEFVARYGGRCQKCGVTYNAIRRGREPGIDVRVRIPHHTWAFFQEVCEKENKSPAEFLRAFVNAKVAAALDASGPIREQVQKPSSNVDFS